MSNTSELFTFQRLFAKGLNFPLQRKCLVAR